MQKFDFRPIIFMGLIITFIFPIFPEAGEIPDGFRTLKWKDPTSSLQDQKLFSKEDDGSEMMVRTTEKLFIGPVELKVILYLFYKNQFYSALILFNEKKGFDYLQKLLITEYGQPIHEYEKDGKKTISWRWEKVGMDLMYNAKSDTGSLSYVYLPLYRDIKNSKSANK